MKNKNLIYLVIVILLVAVASYIYFAVINKEITFAINQKEMIIKMGNTAKIDYSISNEKTTITWKSSDTNIASISNNGIVSANNIGNAVITGTITDRGKEKSITCNITVKEVNYDISLDDFILPEGEILLSTSDTFSIPITYVPSNGFVEKTNYSIQDPSIIQVNDGIIKGKKAGYTTLTITINDISKSINVNVTDKQVSSNIITPLDDISFNDEEIVYVNESKKLVYNTSPSDAYVFDIIGESSNNRVVSIDDDGVIKGISNGDATISLTINNRIKKEINVAVKTKISSISFDYSVKQVLKTGDTLTLNPTILPTNASNKIIYESSNPNALSVDQNGNISAKSAGNATITIKSDDNSVKKTISFTIYNSIGVLNTDIGIWAYEKDTDTIPVRADINFFNELARKGMGIVSDNTYTYQNYSYNINKSTLTINNNSKILVRIYYPPNKDLSTLNTFTFIGGLGEKDFNNYFSKIDNNREIIKSSGIIILIPEGSIKIYYENVIAATNFVKLITKQNKNARNNIGGYSNGGPTAGEVANIGNYDAIYLFNTSIYWIYNKKNIQNMEYVIYTAREDSWRGTDSFIKELYDNGVKNVTVVTNNQKIIDSFKDKYLIINPGNTMIPGHKSDNITNSHYFSFACN